MIIQVRGPLSATESVPHPSYTVYQTILKEIDAAGAEVLAPLGNLTSSDEVASDEVEAVVAARDGRILSNSTILKSYVFSPSSAPRHAYNNDLLAATSFLIFRSYLFRIG
jgi:hypothetical protein